MDESSLIKAWAQAGQQTASHLLDSQVYAKQAQMNALSGNQANLWKPRFNTDDFELQIAKASNGHIIYVHGAGVKRVCPAEGNLAEEIAAAIIEATLKNGV